MSRQPHQKQSANRSRRGAPAFVREQAKAIRLLAGTLSRAKKPRRLAASLRRQLIGIARHWFSLRQRGESVIYPGTAQMETWGECCERTARSNVATLKAWGVLMPMAHETGGAGKATEFVFSVNALWRVLVMMGANPSEELRRTLEVCDTPHKKGAKFGSQIPIDQAVTPTTSAQGIAEKDTPEKGAKKGATFAPRSSYYDRASLAPTAARAPGTTVLSEISDEAPGLNGACYEAGQVDDDRQGDQRTRGLSLREPPAGRSADASLVCLEGFHAWEATGGKIADEAISAEPQPGSFGLSSDAVTFLALLREGPTTYGAAAARLGWGATRSSSAEAELLSAGRACFDQQGRTAVCAHLAEPASPLWGGEPFGGCATPHPAKTECEDLQDTAHYRKAHG